MNMDLTLRRCNEGHQCTFKTLEEQEKKERQLQFNCCIFFLRSFDSLEIINNKNQKFGIYCGLETGRKVTVTGEYVLLIFRSDPSDGKRGFWVFFHAVPVGRYLDFTMSVKCEKIPYGFISFILLYLPHFFSGTLKETIRQERYYIFFMWKLKPGIVQFCRVEAI